MNNSEYLLSICIPSYNRKNELERLINSIIKQDGFTQEVEVVISDWPSSDGTQDMVKQYQKKYKNIKYYRNEINIWMTAALLEVIWYSKGKYSWMFWSDDQMNTMSLKYVIDVIKKESPKLILSTLFHYHKEDEIKHSIQNNEFNVFDWFKNLSDYMWSKKYEKHTLGLEQHFTFMSVFCFETQFFREWMSKVVKEKWESYLLKNYFNYIYIVYSNLKIGKIILFKDNFVLLKYSNNCSRSVKWKIYNDLNDLLNMIKNKYKLSCRFLLFITRVRLFFVTLTVWALINRFWLADNKIYVIVRKFLIKAKL